MYYMNHRFISYLMTDFHIDQLLHDLTASLFTLVIYLSPLVVMVPQVSKALSIMFSALSIMCTVFLQVVIQFAIV